MGLVAKQARLPMSLSLIYPEYLWLLILVPLDPGSGSCWALRWQPPAPLDGLVAAADFAHCHHPGAGGGPASPALKPAHHGLCPGCLG